jgi:signal transduction histidine kinase
MLDRSILDVLQNVAALEGVPEGQLQWLISKGEVLSLAKDDPLLNKGKPLDHMYVILSGNLMLKAEQVESFRTVGEIGKGSITGSLPYSRAKEAAYHAIALQDSTVLAVHKKHFPAMIKTHFELTEALVHFMATRIREFTKFQQQNEKMMALGKLSAGLAHELNNPSAAVVRSAQSLKDHLIALREKFKEVVKIKMTDEQIDQVTRIIFQHIANNYSPDLSITERTEKEEDLLEWLNEKQVENSEEIAENFVEYNFTLEKIEQIWRELSPDHLSPVINWFNQTILMDRLVGEIHDAAQKINDLVLSIKTYTHMDQSPEKQQADIHSSINNTLNIMQHRIRKADIVVEKEFQENLPQPLLKISEFNQVWTNLIDNAIDALENTERKILKIKTRQDGDYIKINITDTGSGIADEHKEKIFDPFFTTKAVDKGTGLGLDMVKQVIQQHNGSITVSSRPGETDFEVCIPIK